MGLGGWKILAAPLVDRVPVSVSRSSLKDRARGGEGGPGGVMYVEGGREEHLLSSLDSFLLSNFNGVIIIVVPK